MYQNKERKKELQPNKWKICRSIPALHLRHVENLIKTLLRGNALIQFNHFNWLLRLLLLLLLMLLFFSTEMELWVRENYTRSTI